MVITQKAQFPGSPVMIFTYVLGPGPGQRHGQLSADTAMLLSVQGCASSGRSPWPARSWPSTSAASPAPMSCSTSNPSQFRRLLLTFEETIQGHIPAILGDDEEERVDTLVRLLRGTSEEDLNTLLESLQTALARLDRERRREERRRAERADRHRDHVPITREAIRFG